MENGDRMEVRCCCVPQKLMGWLHWPNRAQTVMNFTLLNRVPFAPDERAAPLNSRTEFVTLKISHYYYPESGRYHEAIKAEGVPIEKLRRIRGFVENPARTV